MTPSDALDRTLLDALPTDHHHPDLRAFYALMRDYPTRRGKQLRGLLALRSTAAHGAPWRRGLEAAAALELFQCWVLVHDDVEDDSEERRGAPTLHRRVGVPVAINVGDAMHVYMWQLVLSAPAEVREPVVTELLRTIHRTAEGQHLDLSWVAEGRFGVSEEEYLTMVELKTAHYTVVAPLRLGALCAGAEPDERLTEAGLALGAAFQIRDDVLNLSPDVTYGKEFAGDLYEGKRTLILAHLFAHASAAEAQEAEERLAKPRAARTEEDVRALLALVERHGSLAYAQSVAEARARDGMAALRGALALLPDQGAAAELARLLDTLVRRRR